MGAEIGKKTKRNFAGSVPNLTLHMDRLLFMARGTPPSIASPAITVVLQYVPGVWRNELPVTVLFESAPAHCKIWTLDGNDAVLR